MCAWAFVVCLFVFVLLLFLSIVYFFSSSLYLFSVQHFISNVNKTEGNNRCAFAEWGVLPHDDIPSSHRLWAQRPWRFPLLKNFCHDLPGWIGRHRHGDLVLVWCRTRRWDHREAPSSPLFIQEREEPANRRRANGRRLEELEEMDTSELHARRLNAKEVLTSMKGDNFTFPVADEQSKILEEIRIWERPLSSGSAQRRRKK